MADPLPFEIAPLEVKQKLDAGDRLVLIDVREPIEHQICQIQGAHLIPMSSVASRVHTIYSVAEESLVIVYCHHGTRSLQVVSWLREQGVESCQSLKGGIDRWSEEIDPGVPRY